MLPPVLRELQAGGRVCGQAAAGGGARAAAGGGRRRERPRVHNELGPRAGEPLCPLRRRRRKPLLRSLLPLRLLLLLQPLLVSLLQALLRDSQRGRGLRACVTAALGC